MCARTWRTNFEDSVVDLTARCRPRLDRGGCALTEATEDLRAPFLVRDLPRDRLVEEAGIEGDGCHLVVPFGVAWKAADDAVEIEKDDVDH